MLFRSADISHLEDWGKIASGMYLEYPSDRVTIKGNCSEIGRCYYFPYGKHSKVNNSSEILSLVKGWNKVEFIKHRMSEWFDEIKQKNVNCGYDILDLFYWEHRMGSWQAQSQLEWDIVQEVLTPFNNRELLDSMLAVDAKYRCEPNYYFFKKIIQKQWAQTLKVSINPKSVSDKIKYVLKFVLYRLKL